MIFQTFSSLTRCTQNTCNMRSCFVSLFSPCQMRAGFPPHEDIAVVALLILQDPSLNFQNKHAGALCGICASVRVLESNVYLIKLFNKIDKAVSQRGGLNTFCLWWCGLQVYISSKSCSQALDKFAFP